MTQSLERWEAVRTRKRRPAHGRPAGKPTTRKDYGRSGHFFRCTPRAAAVPHGESSSGPSRHAPSSGEAGRADQSADARSHALKSAGEVARASDPERYVARTGRGARRAWSTSRIPGIPEACLPQGPTAGPLCVQPCRGSPVRARSPRPRHRGRAALTLAWGGTVPRLQSGTRTSLSPAGRDPHAVHDVRSHKPFSAGHLRSARCRSELKSALVPACSLGRAVAFARLASRAFWDTSHRDPAGGEGTARRTGTALQHRRPRTAWGHATSASRPASCAPGRPHPAARCMPAGGGRRPAAAQGRSAPRSWAAVLAWASKIMAAHQAHGKVPEPAGSAGRRKGP